MMGGGTKKREIGREVEKKKLHKNWTKQNELNPNPNPDSESICESNVNFSDKVKQQKQEEEEGEKVGGEKLE